MSVSIKLCGIVTGTVTVSALDITVHDLATRINWLRGHAEDEPLKMLARGKVLSQHERSLESYGIAPGSKVVVMNGQTAQPRVAPAASAQPAERTEDAPNDLQRLLAAVEAVCSRTAEDGLSKHQFVLEDQMGNDVKLSRDDRKALSMGMVLHEHGRAAMDAADMPRALQLLELSERAFSLACLDAVGAVDNVALMLIDLVWCCFKLQEKDKLAISGARLDRARRDLERAHGPDLSRLRQLQGGFCPEVATYVRLDLLCGICAFYNGDFEQASTLLQRSQQLLRKLQVSEASLLALMNMGFPAQLSTRALRFCGNDVARAVEFCFQQQRDKEARAERRARTHGQQQLQRRLGRTFAGKWLDMDALEQLEGLGFPRLVAAEALKRSENDVQTALDMLGNELTREYLEAEITGTVAPTTAAGAEATSTTAEAASTSADAAAAGAPEQNEGSRQGPPDVNEQLLEGLLAQGYKAYYARWALHKCKDNLEGALRALESWGSKTRADHDRAAAPNAADTQPPGESAEVSGQEEAEEDEEDEPDWAAEQDVVQGLRSVCKDPLAAYDVDTSEEAAALDQFMCEVQLRLTERQPS